MKNGLLVTVIFFGMSYTTQASVIETGETKAAGNACARGQVKLVVRDDRLQVQFEAFRVKSGERKSCNLAVPIQWPAGKILVVGELRAKGLNGPSQKTPGHFGIEIFSPGKRGTPFSVSLPDSQGAFEQIAPGKHFRSACGGNTILRLNSHLEGGQGDITLDQLEANLTLEPCT